jgi:hypothetical protein
MQLNTSLGKQIFPLGIYDQIATVLAQVIEDC